MVTELLQCDLHDALGQESLVRQLAWRHRGHRVALDIATGMSCARHSACMLHCCKAVYGLTTPSTHACKGSLTCMSAILLHMQGCSALLTRPD